MSGADQRLFADAQAYQDFMGRWSAVLAERFLDFAGLDDGDRVLDIGTGTGALIAAISRRAPRASIAGIDPSPEYIAFASARVPNASLQVGDAQSLPLKDATFDRALCQLVLNFIPDIVRAIAEMRRVTRSGGTVAAANWDLESGMGMLTEFWDAVGPAGDINPYGERQSALTKEELVALWRETGLTDVTAVDIEFASDFTSFDDYWLPFMRGQGPSGKYTASLGQADRDALRDRLCARLTGGRTDKAFSLPTRAFAVRGIVR
ncbi:MAG TPA: methyltransferase domain-containing protein [Candidatus Binatus sp.]|nr:methyltransferase domain-containing protein [Candidatus Binatus sp.]